jgi:hypothetical protein
MDIRFSQQSIIPDFKVELGGYGYFLSRVSIGVLDEIRVKTLILTANGTNLLIISFDLIGLEPYFVQSLKKQILRYFPEISLVLINSTHTHSAPQTLDLTGCGKVNPKYLRFLKDKTIQSLNECIKKSVKKVLNIESHNLTTNQIAVNKNTGEKQYISILNLLIKTTKSTLLLSNLPCHPVLLGNQNKKISKDLINAYEKLIKNNIVDNYIIFTGPCADIIPLILKEENNNAHTSDVNIQEIDFKNSINSLYQILKNNLTKESKSKINISDIEISRELFHLEYDIPPNLSYKNLKKVKKYYLKYFTNINGKIEKFVDRKTEIVINKYRDTNKMITKLKSKIYFVKMNRLILVFLPFEIDHTILKGIDKNVWMNCYSNGVLGYICSKRNNYGAGRGSLLYNPFPYKENTIKKLNKFLESKIRVLKTRDPDPSRLD